MLHINIAYEVHTKKMTLKTKHRAQLQRNRHFKTSFLAAIDIILSFSFDSGSCLLLTMCPFTQMATNQTSCKCPLTHLPTQRRTCFHCRRSNFLYAVSQSFRPAKNGSYFTVCPLEHLYGMTALLWKEVEGVMWNHDNPECTEAGRDYWITSSEKRPPPQADAIKHGSEPWQWKCTVPINHKLQKWWLHGMKLHIMQEVWGYLLKGRHIFLKWLQKLQK